MKLENHDDDEQQWASAQRLRVNGWDGVMDDDSHYREDEGEKKREGEKRSRKERNGQDEAVKCCKGQPGGERLR